MIKKLLLLFGLPAMAILIGVAYVLSTSTTNIQVGRQTTYITTPLNDGGLPDFAAYITARNAEGVTLENNAAVLMWQAVGRHQLDMETFRRLCTALEIDPSSIISPPLVSIMDQPLVEHLGSWLADRAGGQQNVTLQGEIDVSRLVNNLRCRPWTTAQFPPLADWIHDNQVALDMLAEASRRPRCYTPPLETIGDGSPLLITSQWPGQQLYRRAVSSLGVRAMWHLGEGRPQEAWEDVLACFRLARLASQGPSLIDGLIAVVAETMACEATAAVLSAEPLSSKLAERIHQDLSELPPLRPLADSFDEAERLACLEVILALATNDPAGNEIWQGEPPPAFLTSRVVDWNEVLREVNRWYDRLVSVARIEERALRVKAQQQLEDELTSLRPDVKQMVSSLVSGRRRAQLVSHLIISMWLPSLQATSNASDRARTRLDLTRTAAALRCYRNENGGYPAQLELLVPAYLNQPATDLYSGKSYRYELRGEGFLLYSLGENQRDDQAHDTSDEIVDGEWLPIDQPFQEETPRNSSDSSRDLVIRIPVPPLAIKP